MVKGKQAGTDFPLGAEVVVGREGGNQVDIEIEDTKASRKHLKIVLNAGAHFLVDLGSRNGTLVNGKKVSRVKLKKGDRITIGKTEFEYVSAAESKPRKAPDSTPEEAPALTETMSRPVQSQGKRKQGTSAKVRKETYDQSAFEAGPWVDAALLSEDLGQRSFTDKLIVAFAALAFLGVLGWLAYWLTSVFIG